MDDNGPETSFKVLLLIVSGPPALPVFSDLRQVSASRGERCMVLIVLSCLLFEIFPMWFSHLFLQFYFAEKRKSIRASALSLISQITSPWLGRGGILFNCEGLITRFKVFHQSLGPRVSLFSLSARLSLTACLDFLISLLTWFLIFLYFSWSELALLFLYFV